MLTGSLWEAVCALVVGLVGHFTLAPTGTPIADLTQRNKRGGEVVIAFAVLHVFAFAMFWGPAPWVYLGESFPLRVRAKGIALGSASSTSFASLLGWAELTRFSFRLVLELYALVLCPSYLGQVRTPFVLHGRPAAPPFVFFWFIR